MISPFIQALPFLPRVPIITGTIVSSISLVTDPRLISTSCDWQEQQFSVWNKFNASHLSVSDPFQTHCLVSLVTSFPLYSLGMTVLFSPITHPISHPHFRIVSMYQSFKKKSKLSSRYPFFRMSLDWKVSFLSPTFFLVSFFLFHTSVLIIHGINCFHPVIFPVSNAYFDTVNRRGRLTYTLFSPPLPSLNPSPLPRIILPIPRRSLSQDTRPTNIRIIISDFIVASS